LKVKSPIADRKSSVPLYKRIE